MTLKEELEILRGESIKVFTGDPMDIPCIETSDPEKLCKHPVVSVQMITYNHEPYIRQAIEGVMMQQTDFEFELIIGEDCSQDKTREICFEYQKKYPDKIRVLWWHENVRKFGGNGRRCAARRRGEFVALCEGDDYWIDPLKLQKQVDIMRKYPNVGFCFCGAKLFHQNENRFEIWDAGHRTYQPGIQKHGWFFLTFMLGMGPFREGKFSTGFIMTASTMIRSALIKEIKNKYDIFSWRLRLGDATLWLGASSLMDGYYLPDIVSVYRIADTGVFQNPHSRTGVQIDGHIVRFYYFRKVFEFSLRNYPRLKMFHLFRLVATQLCNHTKYARYALMLSKLGWRDCLAAFRWYMMPYWTLAVFCCLNKYSAYLTVGFAAYFARLSNWSPEVRRLYLNVERPLNGGK